MAKFRHVGDLADWRLCLGCGACSYICPTRNIELREVLEEGIRPLLKSDTCETCNLCLQVCPGFEVDHRQINTRPGTVPELVESCGPVLEVWEGHATDKDIRFNGSSGGLLTALSLYCLESGGMHGVLHVGMDPDNPTINQTRMSRSRADLLKGSGSRYAPASACDSLHLIEHATGPCVFVGQPSEITALRKAENLRPGLSRNIGLALSFFCAGSPSRKGTIELLKKHNIDPTQVADLRYRGKGWPGHFAVTLKGESVPVLQMTYADSWAFVQAYRPLSTHLCPDGTGEDADITCGDPWYREVKQGEIGSSLIAVRTEKGRAILRAAAEAGYIEITPSTPQRLIDSQRNLLAKRGAIGGRVAAMRLLGIPTPRLHGFSLFKNWLKLSFNEKLRSTLGTIRRAFSRGHYRPSRVSSSLSQK